MSTLDKPFEAVVKAIKLKKRLTPKGMRRTYRDMARRAKVPEIVTERAAQGAASGGCTTFEASGDA